MIVPDQHQAGLSPFDIARAALRADMREELGQLHSAIALALGNIRRLDLEIGLLSEIVDLLCEHVRSPELDAKIGQLRAEAEERLRIGLLPQALILLSDSRVPLVTAALEEDSLGGCVAHLLFAPNPPPHLAALEGATYRGRDKGDALRAAEASVRAAIEAAREAGELRR